MALLSALSIAAISHAALGQDKAWFGVDVVDTERSGFYRPVGAKVVGVVSGGPAHRAGIRRGDIITIVDGFRVKNSSDLIYEISLSKIGARMNLGLWAFA